MSGDRRAEHVAAIVALVDSREARCGTTHLVAIDGPSGSGKTTLAIDAAAALGAPTVRMDDLYPGWDGLRAATELLESWVVEPLRLGRPARYRRWDWAADRYAEWVQLPASEVIVVDGCGSGALPAGRALSALVWVEAPEPLRKARGLARDQGYGPFWDRWAAQERSLYAADGTRARADLVIDTGDERL
jgi:cytidylate kinase